MKQKKFSVLLRAVVALCGLVWLFFFNWFGREFVLSLLEPTEWNGFICTLRFLLLIPVLIAMIDAWRVLVRLGNNNSFCRENARDLRRISFCALTDTVLVIIWGIYSFSRESIPLAYGNGWFYMFLLVAAIFGVAASAVTAALSHLTHKAADLQDENDLTI